MIVPKALAGRKTLIGALRGSAMLSMDAAAVAVGAWLLWEAGDTLVTDGPLRGYVLFVLAVALAFLVRYLVSGIDTFRRRENHHIGSDRALIGAECAVLSLLVILWAVTGEYYLGWVACFGAVAMTAGSLIQLMFDVTTGRNDVEDPRERSLLAQRLVSLEATRLAGVVVALVVFALVTPVHQWNPALIDPLLLLTSLAFGLSFTLGLLIRRGFDSRRRSAAEPIS